MKIHDHLRHPYPKADQRLQCQLDHQHPNPYHQRILQKSLFADRVLSYVSIRRIDDRFPFPCVCSWVCVDDVAMTTDSHLRLISRTCSHVGDQERKIWKKEGEKDKSKVKERTLSGHSSDVGR